MDPEEAAGVKAMIADSNGLTLEEVEEALVTFKGVSNMGYVDLDAVSTHEGFEFAGELTEDETALAESGVKRIKASGKSGVVNMVEFLSVWAVRGQSAPEDPGRSQQSLPPDELSQQSVDRPVQEDDPEEQGAEEEDQAASVADGALVEVYRAHMQSANRKCNVLVEQSLDVPSGQLLSLIAPGNHPRVFNLRLEDQDVSIIMTTLEPVYHSLAKIDLSYNKVGNAGAQALAKGCTMATRLHTLMLRCNDIGQEGCDALCKTLRDCHSLRKLDFAQNPLGKLGGLSIAELLQVSVTLQELAMEDAQIDVDALIAVVSVLHVSNQSLKMVNLGNPRLFSQQEEHTTHIARMLRVNTGLTEVFLPKMRIRDTGMEVIVSYLLENKTLRVLDLRCNEIGWQGGKLLGVLLGTDCQLMRLNVSSNRIGEHQEVEGTRAISKALLHNRMLVHLDMNHNQLCDQALLELASAVDANGTLESVALFHNGWGQAASVAFHRILGDRSRVFAIKADFQTYEVDQEIFVCQTQSESRPVSAYNV